MPAQRRAGPRVAEPRTPLTLNDKDVYHAHAQLEVERVARSLLSTFLEVCMNAVKFAFDKAWSKYSSNPLYMAMDIAILAAIVAVGVCYA